MTGVDENAFLEDEILAHACLMLFLVIGECCGKISKKFRDKHISIDWLKIKNARNFYIHDYDLVDWEMVWQTIIIDLPLLKENIKEILEIQEKENNAKTN